jgi:hypothetical protein
MVLKDFQWIEHEKIVLTPCFEIVAASSSSLDKAAPGLLQFYEEFMHRFVAGLKYYRTGTMRNWRRPTDKALQMVSAWTSEPRNIADRDFMITFHSGPSEVEMLPPSIELNFENGTSYVSARFAPDFLASGAEPVLDFVRTAIGNRFALSAGWGGYAIAFNEAMGPLVGQPREKLRGWLKRHSGLGHGQNFAIYERALHGISNVNWLTLLGAELLNRKGGRQSVAAALAARSTEIVVNPLGDGAIIQAGKRPEIGDLNRGDDLPLYREVGRYLKDLRTTKPPRFLFGFEDDTEEWFARFDA